MYSFNEHVRAKNINERFIFIPAGSEELGDIDSLDGQLPSSASAGGHRASFQPDRPSSYSAQETSLSSAVIPPPPLVAPSADGNGSSPFSKGPGARNKRHRKLNKEQVSVMMM